MTIPTFTLNAYSVAQLVVTLVDFYEMLIIVYILLSWFPIREGSLVHDIGMVLQSLCEPYLGLFRRFIPPDGRPRFLSRYCGSCVESRDAAGNRYNRLERSV